MKDNIVKIEKQFNKWANKVLAKRYPNLSYGYSFNIWETAEGGYGIDLVGTHNFSLTDPDWACDEEWSTVNENNSFYLKTKELNWEDVLELVKNLVANYLKNGKQTNMLAEACGVGYGFVDGDIEIIYVNPNFTPYDIKLG